MFYTIECPFAINTAQWATFATATAATRKMASWTILYQTIAHIDAAQSILALAIK